MLLVVKGMLVYEDGCLLAGCSLFPAYLTLLVLFLQSLA